MHKNLFKSLTGAFLFLCSVTASAQLNIVEEVVKVPATVKNLYGKTVTHNVVVTVVRDANRTNAPYIVINHGRAGSAERRSQLGRITFPDVSKYLVEKGFVVIAPTRGGYGETGGEDTEDDGYCARKDYGAAFKVVADTTVAVLNNLKDKPYIDINKGLIFGQSFGGASAVALSTYELPGMRAAFNFAGGAGGDPVKTPAAPCRPDTQEKLFASYGAKSRVPVYWFYSENDKYWGAKLPKEWFEAFIKAGGKGEFYTLPPYKNDGHRSFTENAETWKPIFEERIKSLGFVSK